MAVFEVLDVSRVAVGPGGEDLAPAFGGALSPDQTRIAFDNIVKDLATGAITTLNVPGYEGVRAEPWSPDGQSILLRAVATDPAVAGRQDLFLYDFAAANAQLIATDVFEAAFSPDGSRIAFTSEAATHVPDDTNQALDVFVRDLATGDTSRVSVAADGSEANHESNRPTFSPDGAVIAFVSGADNLVAGDANAARDVFLKNLATGSVTRVSVDDGGGEANGSSDFPSFSPDGGAVVFDSGASNLVAGDTNGTSDIFLKSLVTGDVMRVNVGQGGEEANAFSQLPVFSPDGQRIGFTSEASNLVVGDTNRAVDGFVKDLVSGAVARVTVAADGTQGNGASFGIAFAPDATTLVVGSDASNLVPDDPNNVRDIFLVTTNLEFGVPLDPGPTEPPPPTVIVGTAGPDTLAGTDQNDVLDGRGGDDVLQGLAGDDELFGRAGDDTLEGGFDMDVLRGGPGDDRLDGGFENDVLRGGDGDDSLDGGPGDDELRGGAGNDSLSGGTSGGGGAGNDRLFGGPGDDHFLGGLGGADVMYGNDGNDLFESAFFGFGSLGTVYGGRGEDTILGGEASERLFGGADNDLIRGFEGNDDIFGNDGNDQLFGNTAFATAGIARLFGGNGDDLLSGGFTTPSMYGGAGDDTLVLGRFDPQFQTAPGRPYDFSGGPGFDTLDIGPRSGALTSSFSLSADDNVFGIERIAMLPPGPSTPIQIALDEAGVVGASNETNTLIVDGDARGTVLAAGDWIFQGAQEADGNCYDVYLLGRATLFVDADLTFTLV